MEEVHNLKGFFKSIEAGLKDLNIIYDIGAYKGSWTQEVSGYVPKETKFYLFEPNKEHNSDLSKTGHLFYNTVLSDKEKYVDFFSINGTGDSYYKERSIHYKDTKPVTVKADTLDSFITNNNIPKPDILKIDTQGSELDILRGGMECLSNAKIVMLECSIQSYNLGAPGIESVIEFMVNNGFTPHFITEIHTLDIPIYQIDIAFLRIR